MIVIESIGRKLKDAIDNGLAQLGKSLTEVDVEVLDHGGLFRKAKVRITVMDDETETEPEAKQEAITEAKPEIKQEVKTELVAPVKRVISEPKPRRERPVREEKKERAPRKDSKDAPRKENKEFANKERKEKEQPAKEEQHREPRHYEPVTIEVAKKAEDFVTELVAKMGIEARVETSIEEGELLINLTATGSTLIGYHGEVLDSIEYMTSYVINRESDKFYRLVVNCNNYREKRKESLVALANKMAAKCLKVRHKIVLEPMNSTERKIIHSALADNDQIITRSEGHDPNRHIVILCKKR